MSIATAAPRLRSLYLTVSEGFTRRLFKSWMDYQGSLARKATHEELAKKVGELVRGSPLSQPTASGWFNGAVPDLDTIAALATVLGVSPGWLAFGDDWEDELGSGAIPEEPDVMPTAPAKSHEPRRAAAGTKRPRR